MPTIYDGIPVNETFRCVVCGHDATGSDTLCSCCESCPHCVGCAQPEDDCVCCDCHDTYPCPGDGDSDDDDLQHGGTNQQTPWERRGEHVPNVSKYASWQLAWPTLASSHGNLDPCRSAADFYLLDALRHAVLNRQDCPRVAFNESYDLRVIQQEAEMRFSFLVDVLDEVFCEYVEMACGGELRHHGAFGGRIVSAHRRTAWAQWKAIHEHLGHQALLDMAELFAEFGSGAFGGARWGNAAKMLHERLTGQITKAQWVDRVFALVHNGGVFLNKLDWAIQNNRGWGLGYLQQNVLPAADNDSWRTLLSVASRATVYLWNEYWIVTNRTRLHHGVPPAVNPYRQRRRRRICSCGTNPVSGHLMTCRWFIQGCPESGKDHNLIQNVVEEDDFYAYNWQLWEAPPETLPVGPNGEVRIQPHIQYSLHVWVHSLATVSHRRYQMNGAEMMTTNIQLKPLVVEMEAWWPILDSQYQWRIQLTTDMDDIVLDTCQGTPQTKEAISSVTLPLEFLLPHLMTEVDWSQVQGGPNATG